MDGETFDMMMMMMLIGSIEQPHASWVLLWQNAQFAQTFVCCDGFWLALELVILTECNYLLNDSVGNILIRFASIKEQHLNEYA